MEPTLCYGAFSDVTSWDSGYQLVRILDHIFSFLVSICAPSRLVPKPNNLLQIASSKYCIAGLLGSVTQTANVAACPGKCIHALASLMCDTVLEEVKSQKNLLFLS